MKTRPAIRRPFTNLYLYFELYLNLHLYLYLLGPASQKAATPWPIVWKSKWTTVQCDFSGWRGKKADWERWWAFVVVGGRRRQKNASALRNNAIGDAPKYWNNAIADAPRWFAPRALIVCIDDQSPLPYVWCSVCQILHVQLCSTIAYLQVVVFLCLYFFVFVFVFALMIVFVWCGVRQIVGAMIISGCSGLVMVDVWDSSLCHNWAYYLWGNVV